MGGFGFLLIIFVAVYLLGSMKILAEYERGIVFRLGRLLEQPKGPGLVLVFWPVDAMVRISLRQQTLELPPQDFVTHDDVTLTLRATIFLRVIDPRRAVVQASNYQDQTAQLAQDSLRSVLAELTLDDAREGSDKLSLRMRTILDQQTAAWGLQVENVVVKQVDGPGSTPHVPRAAS